MARILLVEDDQATRELYEVLLKEAGHKIDSVSDGKAGFEKAVQGGYDLILLDIMLPQMDGITILEELKKANAIRKNKKIVMLTTLRRDEVIKSALKLGADGYLMKTVLKPAEVLKEVEAYLVQES